MALLVAPVVLPTFGTTFSQSAKVLAESSSNSQIRQKNAGKSGNDPKMDPMFLKAGLHVWGSYQQSSMSARDKCIETI